MLKYPSTGQYRDAVKWQSSYCNYHNVPTPTVTFEGTVKLHGCFSKDTPVTMSTGERRAIKDIKKGDFVLSYDTATGHQVEKQVTSVWPAKSLDKEWVRLKFDDGRVLECTEDHKIFTANRGWVEASQLTTDDEFVVEQM